MVMDLSDNFEILDHPSDIGIRAAAETLERLFEICAAGMFSVMCRLENVIPDIKKEIRVYEKYVMEPEEMLIGWLDKLLYIHEVEKILFRYFHIIKLNPNGLIAEASGQKIDPAKHELFVSIKAPTYHMLEVKKDEKKRWSAQVIFDV